MLIYENKKAKLLNVIKVGLNPFKKFVSTGELEEELPLVKSRQDFINNIKTIIEKNQNFILPIIGETGLGKTHLFWAIRNELDKYNSIYISLETIFKKFYYNIYSKFIEKLGVENLRTITRKLCNDWGALEKRFGFFNVVEIEKIRKTAFEKLSKILDEKASLFLMDSINAITAHQLDPYKKVEAERWLLGELMDFRQLSRLNLMADLRDENNAYTMLKILIENSKLGTVVFIDDFEKIISVLKPDAQKESEAIFEPTWLYGDEGGCSDSATAQNLLDKILQLLSIRGLRIVITLKSNDTIEEVKKIVQEKNKKLLITFKETLFLSGFTESDIYELYKNNLRMFLKSINYLQFLDEYPDTYYPLNELILKNSFLKSKGNPREAIKYLIKIFNDIINSEDNLETILKPYEAPQ